MSQKGFFAGI